MSDKNKETYDFYGYTVTRDGKIYDAHGKERHIQKNGAVKLRVGEKWHYYAAARVIYEAVSGKKVKGSDCTIYKDGDRHNLCYENLSIVSRMEYFKTNKTGKAHKMSTQEVNAIIREYDYDRRKAYDFRGAYKHPTYDELAKKYHCSKSTVVSIVKGEYFTKQRERVKCKKK